MSLNFLSRPMPPLTPAVIMAVRTAPVRPSSNGTLAERHYTTEDGKHYFQQADWVTTAQAYGASPDSDAVITDPNLIDWNKIPIQQTDLPDDQGNQTNYGAVYHPITGQWIAYFLGTDNNSWKDAITVALIIVGGYYGGTWLSETYGAAGAGTVAEGVSGMDLAADAGMSSVNSGGGAIWGGGEAAGAAGGSSVGDSFNFQDIYDSLDYSGQGSSFDTGTFDPGTSGGWEGGGWEGDTGSLFPDANAYPPVNSTQYPIPEIQISPAQVSSGTGFSFTNALGQVKEITGVALTVASMVKSFQQTGQVQDPTAANRSANGGTGLILTRNANGQITTQRPQVGVATVTSDGGLIINNGDGTYTYISPSGQRVTRRYGDSTVMTTNGSGLGGLNINVLLLGGAALLGVLALSRR